MPKIRTLVVIVLASAMVVPADRHASTQEIVRGIINRGVSPTPGTIPLPPTPPPGLGIDIGTIPWTESNLATLRKADKADVVRLLNGIRTDNSHGIMPPDDVSEFSWVDLAGNGKYALVLVQTPTACRVCTSILLICRQSERRKITTEILPGTYPLSRAIRDLNGDGKKELIIQPPLDPTVVGGGPIPLVYRLENGKYVEASKDFASYYDAEVLSPIENAISQARFRLADGPIGAKASPRWLRYMRHTVAGLTMERDKILRMIGRDPHAGLKQAREWMNSPDAASVQDAITVFKDLGGHESDLRVATARLKAEGCDVNGFGPSALRGDKAEADWHTYRNAKNGLSFRYPPSMRVEERDPAKFGLDPPADAIVDVRGSAGILRLICADGVKTPEMAAATLRRFRKQSSEDERPCATIQIDGHEAFVGGPLSGPWAVNILQPRGCAIFPMATLRLNDPPPHDGRLPLLSIVRTVHFESVPSRH